MAHREMINQNADVVVVVATVIVVIVIHQMYPTQMINRIMNQEIMHMR
jgi:hypothetical protein